MVSLRDWVSVDITHVTNTYQSIGSTGNSYTVIDGPSTVQVIARPKDGKQTHVVKCEVPGCKAATRVEVLSLKLAYAEKSKMIFAFAALLAIFGFFVVSAINLGSILPYVSALCAIVAFVVFIVGYAQHSAIIFYTGAESLDVSDGHSVSLAYAIDSSSGTA